MDDAVAEALRKQMEGLRLEMVELKEDLNSGRQEVYELREDIYSDARRRRVGVLERIEQMEIRQKEHAETLEAFERREAARAKREDRRIKVINSLLGIITTIVVGFAIAGINQFFWA